MTAEDIHVHVRRRPFEPFRVRVTDGAHYDARSPELILVTRSEIVIAFRPLPGAVADRKVFIDPIDITRITPLNGRRRRRA
jgi:hypothetical protein